MPRNKALAKSLKKSSLPRDYREPTKGEELGRFVLSRIHAAKAHREQQIHADSQWQRGRKRFEGVHWKGQRLDREVDSSRPRDRATVNLTGSIILDMNAFLFFNEIEWKVKAKGEQWVPRERQCSALLNKKWDMCMMMDQLDEAKWNLSICGTAVIQTGYTLKFDETQTPEKDGKIVNPAWIKEDNPWIESIELEDFVPDPDAPQYNLDSCSFVAKRFRIPYSELVTNKEYSQDVRTRILAGEFNPVSSETYMEAHVEKSEFAKLNAANVREIKMCDAWEYFDLKQDRYIVYADGVPLPLMEPERMSEKFKHIGGRYPFVVGYLIKPRKSFWGIGIARWIEDHQDQINFHRTHQMRHVRRCSNTKYLVRKGAFAEGEVEVLTNGEDGVYAEVKGDVRTAVAALEHANIPADLYVLEPIIKQDIREITGSDELMRSGNMPSRTTAREVQARTGIIGIKLEGKTAEVKKMCKRLGQHVWQWIQKFMTLEEVIELMNEAEASLWKTLTDQDIAGNYQVDLEPIAKQNTDPALKQQLFDSTMKFVTQNIMNIQMALRAEGKQLKFSRMLAEYLKIMEAPHPEQFFSEAAVVPLPVTPTLEQPGQASLPGPTASDQAADPLSALVGGNLGGAVPQ